MCGRFSRGVPVRDLATFSDVDRAETGLPHRIAATVENAR